MTPLQITYRTVVPTAAIDTYIKKNFNRLSKINRHMLSARVVVDISQNHKHKGKLFNVSVDSIVPGKELVSKKQDEDLYNAIRSAFAATQRLLQKHKKN